MADVIQDPELHRRNAIAEAQCWQNHAIDSIRTLFGEQIVLPNVECPSNSGLYDLTTYSSHVDTQKPKILWLNTNV